MTDDITDKFCWVEGGLGTLRCKEVEFKSNSDTPWAVIFYPN